MFFSFFFFPKVVMRCKVGGRMAGGVLKKQKEKKYMERRKDIWERQAGCDNERAARDKRVVSGGSRSLRLGIKEGHFNQVVCIGGGGRKKNQPLLCEIIVGSLVQG